MALSRKSVEKACDILKVVAGPLKAEGIIPHQLGEQTQRGLIYGFDPKMDGGYENVFTDIEAISDDQLQKFEELRTQVPNTSIMRRLENNLTRIGWF